MPEFTDVEKEFRINLSEPSFDIAKGIEVAIAIEERAHKFYSEKAKKASEPLRPFFRFMAQQELEHESILDSLKKMLAQSKLWVALPPSQIEGPIKNLAAFKKQAASGKESTGDLEALMIAMANEKKTREFYMKFANTIKSPEGRKFFFDLAEWEKKHYDMLSGIYHASSYERLET
jgi:rubrerythrin